MAHRPAMRSKGEVAMAAAVFPLSIIAWAAPPRMDDVDIAFINATPSPDSGGLGRTGPSGRNNPGRLRRNGSGVWL